MRWFVFARSKESIGVVVDYMDAEIVRSWPMNARWLGRCGFRTVSLFQGICMIVEPDPSPSLNSSRAAGILHSSEMMSPT